jgi:ribosome biogenesis GTPase
MHYDGLVVKEQSGFYWVEITTTQAQHSADVTYENIHEAKADPTHEATNHAEAQATASNVITNEDTIQVDIGDVIMCRLRGKLKEEAQASDIAAIGDRVAIQVVREEGTDVIKGIIQDVYPRRNTLSRAVRTYGKRGAGQAEREHVLSANVDQAFLVVAATQPTPNFKMLDRLLVATERAHIEHITIVVNKTDLGIPEKVAELFAVYEAMGYEILHTSAQQKIGIDAIKARINHHICVFTGPSGVGKSSLLNAIQPELGRTVKEVSEYSQEGVHTTRDSALVKLESGGYIADTPGIRQLNLWDIEPDELDGYFVDIMPYVDQCRFSNCTHTKEPKCAVRQALEAGHIHKSRYNNYLQLRDELAETYIVYQR